MADKLYMVQAGENLKSIALNQLGEQLRWQEIAVQNSLSHPYIVTPGQLLMLPDVDNPLEIVVTRGSEAATGPPNKSSAVTATKIKLSPAEWGLLISGAALFWLFVKK